MSQAAELIRVKGRIKALTEKTVANGCTEAEAMAAADMVGRLLERYALSMDEIEIRTARCVQAEVPVGGRRRRPIDGCVPTIARFCDCKVWLARPPAPDPEQPDLERMQSGSRYVFFGFETDTVLATYLFAVIDRAVITETAVFKQLNPRFRGVRLRQASASFQHGVVARVSERLDAMHRARDAAVRAQRSTGTALILAKNRYSRRRLPRDGRPADEYERNGSPGDHHGVSCRLGRGRSGEPQSSGAGRCAETARLSGQRDRQRRRVYAWENRAVAPCDPTTLPFAAAQAVVDAIWSDMGLRYPPEVAPLSRKATATVARANRLSILLADRTPSWCVLHELAHAMTSHADGRSDGHGPLFMGVYLQLIVRYLRLDPRILMDSLRDAGIEITRDARPVFVDP